MAIPSGSGTEVLRTALLPTVSNSYIDLIPILNNHIYSILSITVYEKDGIATHTFNMNLYDGSTEYYIIYAHSMPPQSTFIYNDRLVMNAADLNAKTSGTNNWKLRVKSTTAANSGGLSVTCSYIDQDWT